MSNQENQEIKAIQNWILHLMKESTLPHQMLDNSFDMEDGMSLQSYWEYEKENFQSLSQIYDLTQDFSIKVLHRFALKKPEVNIHQNFYFYFIYIINSLNKIVCKMNITLKRVEKDNMVNYYISSNNYTCQIVPKFGIWDGVIKEVGLAIKTPYILKNIISPDLQLIHLQPGNNFDEDGFYSARFLIKEEFENQIAHFYLHVEKNGILIKEKREVFFDRFQVNLKPYEFRGDNLCTVDSTYPVHLAAMGKDKIFNKAYPRSIQIAINDYEQAIVTDCLDNDWHVSLVNYEKLNSTD